jgi:hypothetical protein
MTINIIIIVGEKPVFELNQIVGFLPCLFTNFEFSKGIIILLTGENYAIFWQPELCDIIDELSN